MNHHATYRRLIKDYALLGMAVLLVSVAGCSHKGGGPPPPPPKKDAGKPGAASLTKTNSESEYVSVFETLGPGKLQDPFYPETKRFNVVARSKGGGPAAPQEPALNLTFVIHAPRRSQAVINGAIFELGEDAQMVHVPNGPPVEVKCLEIGDNYAKVQIKGESKPTILWMEKKKN